MIARCLLFSLSLLIAVFELPASADVRYDIVIQGGRVVDGTGAPWFRADVGIRDGLIVRIGQIDPERAAKVLDARDLIVAPGFIDMMGQTATPLLEDPRAALNLLTQGITTINAGEGASAAPLGATEAARSGWSTMAEYFQLLDIKGLPVNVVQSVGHTQVRRIVLGETERRPSDQELARMRDLVREAMEAGATGVSTALIYPPAVYARTEEIAALVEVAGKYGGRYYTHMRNEGDQLLAAIDEALDIGRTGGAPVHIFHLKAAGRQNWGKMQLAIAKIKAARAMGQQVTADIYPYINNGLGIASFIHPRHFRNGRAQLLRRLDDPELRREIRRDLETTGSWENWFKHVGNDWSQVVIGHTDDRRYAKLAGKSLAEIADAVDEDPWDTFFNLVRSGAFALPQSMTEANKILAMQQAFVSFCTDVGPAGGSRIASHPRAFGSFPRLLSRYVRELGAISLERAVAQASAAAANDVQAYDRGRIAAGLAADLIVFDEQLVADRATFANPDELSQGMKYVLVNGTVVFQGGELTGARPGQVLRGPGFRPETRSYRVSTGRTDPRLSSFDEMMTRFMRRHRVPGAALAVTDQGRLVLARGYGYADVAARQQVKPTSLFRVASISKPITAVAILRLVEQQRLDLEDKVFEILDYQPEIDKTEKFDERARAITVRHLLEHRGGWDRDQSFDAMFQSVRFARQVGTTAPAGAHDVIRAMLDQPLDFDPGERYAYSNYGYCLLGRIIEQLTGQAYEKFVRDEILAPIGVRGMRIGRTHLDERQSDEVRYYSPFRRPSVFSSTVGQRTAAPYGSWYLEAMDSHGGWIASAVDLAKFACALEESSGSPLLTSSSFNAMHQRPPGLAGRDKDGKPKSVYYSLGWFNRALDDGRRNHWHTGSLAGTATILIRRHDGRNFVALFNSRVSPSAPHLGRAVDRLLHQAADQIADWPDIDLFDRYDQSND